MLKKIENNALLICCNKCTTEYSSPISTQTFDLVADGTQYRNYKADPCPSCGRVAGFVLNIPVDEDDDFLVQGPCESYEELNAALKPMNYNEINQRYYVRQLIRTVRADHKEVQ